MYAAGQGRGEVASASVMLGLCLAAMGCSDTPGEAPAAETPAASSNQLVVEPSGGRFVLQVHGSNLLGRYFQVLEEAGFFGNGPAWLGVLEHLAAAAPPLPLSGADDESEAAAVYANDRRTLEALKKRLLAATKDRATLVKTFRDARAAGRAPGDL